MTSFCISGRATSGRPIKTYPLEAFLDLKQMIERVPKMYQGGKEAGSEELASLSASVRDFLAKQQFVNALAEIFAHTSSEAAFHKRFFRWFDGFRAMKFVRHARDCFHGEGAVENEAAKLLAVSNCSHSRGSDLSDLLKIYRELDRSQRFGPGGRDRD